MMKVMVIGLGRRKFRAKCGCGEKKPGLVVTGGETKCKTSAFLFASLVFADAAHILAIFYP